MSAKMINSPELTMSQVKADIMIATSCLDQSRTSPNKIAKYLRGQCGYHLQQASEKMIKIQLYATVSTVDQRKIYKHDLVEIITYAKSLGVNLSIPKYIDERALSISSWEAEGRYDVHIVVKSNTLSKCLSIVNEWYSDMLKQGFK